MRPLISVIIPAYNVEKYIRQCVDSICNATYAELEIICVNDGSTDGTLAILEQCREKDPRVIVVDKKNEGVSVARNTGLGLASGEFIHFCDSDDYIEPGLYDAAMPCFQDDIDVVWFEHVQRHEDGTAREFRLAHSGVHSVDGELLLANDHSPINKIFRASCLRRSGTLFPEGIVFEDMAFYWCLFMSSVKKIYFLNEILYNYRIHSSSIMGNTYQKKDNYSICHIYLLDAIHDSWEKHGILEQNQELFMVLCRKNFKLALFFAPDWETAHCCSEMILRLRRWQLPLPPGLLQRLRDGEYRIDIEGLDYYRPKKTFSGPERIFCIRREGRHWVVRLFTLKIASRRMS